MNGVVRARELVVYLPSVCFLLSSPSASRLREPLLLVLTLLVAFPCASVTAAADRAVYGRARRCSARPPLAPAIKGARDPLELFISFLTLLYASPTPPLVPGVTPPLPSPPWSPPRVPLDSGDPARSLPFRLHQSLARSPSSLPVASPDRVPHRSP